MRELPATPVFDRTALRRIGWSDPAVARALTSGYLARPRRGWYARPGADADRAAAHAVAHARAGTVLSDRTATMMHGLPIVGARTPVPELTVPPRWPGNASGAHLRRATLRPEDVTVVDGVLVTSIARTLVDLGRHRSTACAVVALDAALHDGRVTIDEIEAVLRNCWNWPGIRRAQRAVRLADARAESPLESVSRLVMGWLGLPPPQLQPLILDRYGAPVARLDFYWDEFGVAGESDGRAKYRKNEDERDNEKDRQEHLEDDNLHFARWGWDTAWRRVEADGVQDPERVRARPAARWIRSSSALVGCPGRDRPVRSKT
jgi:hypothetical protein